LEIAAALAIVAVLAALLLPSLARSKSRAQTRGYSSASQPEPSILAGESLSEQRRSRASAQADILDEDSGQRKPQVVENLSANVPVAIPPPSPSARAANNPIVLPDS